MFVGEHAVIRSDTHRHEGRLWFVASRRAGAGIKQAYWQHQVQRRWDLPPSAICMAPFPKQGQPASNRKEGPQIPGEDRRECSSGQSLGSHLTDFPWSTPSTP